MSSTEDLSTGRQGRGAADLDAVASSGPAPAGAVDTQVIEDIEEALKDVVDPELGINIVDLGLVYDCAIDPDNARRINIRMTLTAPGCGMGPVLVDEIKLRLTRVPNVAEVNVDLVFDPPWSRDMMTEEAQLELGLF